MLKVSYALILDFSTALSLVNVPLQKVEATHKFCDSYRTRNAKELCYPILACNAGVLSCSPAENTPTLQSGVMLDWC